MGGGGFIDPNVNVNVINASGDTTPTAVITTRTGRDPPGPISSSTIYPTT